MYEQFILNLTGANGWMPHGFCIQWTPSILWSYVVADALIALSYYAIPLVLAYVAWRRKDLQFRRVYLMFCGFILACGTSHLLSIVLLWQPLYWLDAVLKVITAGLSVATAIYLIRLVPLALQQKTSAELENKLLHSFVKQSATELKMLNIQFYETFDNAPIGIINLSPKGIFLEVNQRISDFMGCCKEELVALTFEAIMPPADHAIVAQKMTWCLAGKISEFTLESCYLRQDGKQFWGNTLVKLIRHQDSSSNYFMAMIEDINQRKAAEAILQERDKLYFILNNTPALIGYWDKQLKNLFSNPAYTHWFDKTPEQIKGWHIRQVLGETLYAENLPFINAVIHGEPQKFDRHILCPQTGLEIHTQISYLPHIVNHEVLGFYVLGIDITDQERLTDANYYNLTLLKNLTRGVILTDINKQITYINPAFEKITGYSSEDMLGKSCAILQGEKTDPQQILRIREALSSLQPYQGELLNYRKDGSLFWTELTINPVYDRHGKLIHFIGFQHDISQRKYLEAQLKDNQKLLANLFAHVPGMVYQFKITPDGNLNFPFASDGIKDIYETTPEQVRESATAFIFNIMHPDDLNRMNSSIEESTRTLQPWQLEYRVNLPGKGLRWLSGHSQPERLKDGSTLWHGFIADITERKLLDNERDRLLQLIEESQDFISIADMQGQLTFINRAGFKMVGLPEQSTISGLKINDLHTEQAARRVLEEAVPVACMRGFWEGENTLLHSDGHEIPVSQLLLSHHQGATGSPTFLSTIMRDMTKSKQVERELREAKDNAEHLAQAKSDFLANMSHEIRTPMTAIIGFSQLALTKANSPEITAYLDKINSASTNLLGILNDILDLSKLGAGSVAIYPVLFDIDSLRDNLYNLFISTAEKKGLGFTVTVGTDIPRSLLGDKLRLEQVLINLLSNAIKFTASGSVTLNITLQQLQQSQARLLFSVTDTGIGISATDQNKLFQPFSQVDESITRRFGGTGLGLALSHDLVQLMGGELSLISEFDQGSCFSFELILAISSLSSRDGVPDALESLDSVLQKLGQQLTGCRILVVEDNVFNQQIIQEFLGLSGISVNIANDGQEALLALKNAEFDAVLMDIHMPVMDGFEATRQIRALPGFSTLPIIALTAGVTEEERGQYLAAGMDDFISKPINPVQLLSILAHWLKLADIPAIALGKAPLQEAVEKDQLTAVNPDMTLIEPSLPIKAVSLTDNLRPLPMDRDMCVLRELVGDDPATLAKFLGFFHVSALKISADIITALTTGQAIAASNAAHTLSTSAQSVGALRLGDLCLQIEKAGKDGHGDINTILSDLLPDFEEEWGRVEQYLLAWPDEPNYDIPYFSHNHRPMLTTDNNDHQ
ncbi:PAS domain-containing hybrid sensor histidine kinase/response regulator [Methylobacter psychrophilus]|uniref:PAS domain-containing hybrid sensor histidine kinase/response regulator n=1 Tax=Methylobacter psychrophilus TaxID=96941 RepID=UPI0021D50F81|nr:PAS domain S-box protein [Methylobacter psychrophilus]